MRRALVLLLASSAAAGCESDDPCVLRKAACLDVGMLGKREPVFYRNLSIKVVANVGKTELASREVAELRATAPAGVQGKETFQLPDEFNERDDSPPDKLVENGLCLGKPACDGDGSCQTGQTCHPVLGVCIGMDAKAPAWPVACKAEVPSAQQCAGGASCRMLSEAEKISVYKVLRDIDPRAIHITIDGIEEGAGTSSKVRWDSAEEEKTFSPTQWLQQRYFRVAKNQYLAVYAVLYPSATP